MGQLRVSRKGEVGVNIDTEVKRFKYLCSMNTADGRSKSEIRVRIGMATGK